jgi:hypothetical protein
MLARTFSHLLRTKRHPIAIGWLKEYLQAELVACLGVSGGCAQIEARRQDDVKTFLWSGADILSKMEQRATETAVALAWVVCRFHDVNDETDSMLRDYVKSMVGLVPEPVPFAVTRHTLVLRCSRKSCSGSAKKSTEVDVATDGDVVLFKLPLTSPSLRELLLGRLRRTVL